jgi:hypothetical protein
MYKATKPVEGDKISVNAKLLQSESYTKRFVPQRNLICNEETAQQGMGFLPSSLKRSLARKESTVYGSKLPL